MKLNDKTIRNAKATDKPIKLADGGGLYLYVLPPSAKSTGAKLWRQKYRHAGKEKLLAHGAYPDVSLKDARDKRDAARKQIAAGIDPNEQRRTERDAKAERNANTFEFVAREWHGKQRQWSDKHRRAVLRYLENDMFPSLGERPVADITTRDVRVVIDRVADRGAVTIAAQELQICGQVFNYAIASGRAERNPCAHLKRTLPSVQTVHRAAITEPVKVGKLLLDIDHSKSYFPAKCALRLAPLLFVRPGELRAAEWAEIDLDSAEWNIPAAKMKMRDAHLVPLAPQAIAILRELHALTGHGRYVFPNARDPRKTMSHATILAALRALGYGKDEMSVHGFRAIARTLLDEVLGFRPDFIEHQLAHAVRDPNGRAYNRTAHLTERRAMMAAWADYLDKLKASDTNVVRISRSKAA